jgi:uncharacterized protein (DUF488 family)
MIYTIGYSKWSVEGVRAKINELGVDLLVDVRSTPYGRFYPKFNRPELEKEFGARYRWMGKCLGGKPGPATEEGIEWLIAEHEKGSTLLILCVEMDPRNCHRLIDIGARLLARGLDAIHLIHDGTQRTTNALLQMPARPERIL